jgi:hypothetical protein
VAFHLSNSIEGVSPKIITYTTITTFFFLGAFFLTRIGALKFNILKQKLIDEDLDGDIITKSYKLIIDFQDFDAKEAYLLTEYEFICLKKTPYHELKSSLKAGTGEIEVLDSFNCTPHIEGDKTINIRSLKKNLKEGQRVKYMYSAIARNVFPEEEEYWNMNLKHFTQDCTVEIRFPPGRKIKEKYCKLCDGNTSKKADMIIPTPIFFKSEGREILIFKAENFTAKECYKIGWVW